MKGLNLWGLFNFIVLLRQHQILIYRAQSSPDIVQSVVHYFLFSALALRVSLITDNKHFNWYWYHQPFTVNGQVKKKSCRMLQKRERKKLEKRTLGKEEKQTGGEKREARRPWLWKPAAQSVASNGLWGPTSVSWRIFHRSSSITSQRQRRSRGHWPNQIHGYWSNLFVSLLHMTHYKRWRWCSLALLSSVLPLSFSFFRPLSLV